MPDSNRYQKIFQKSVCLLFTFFLFAPTFLFGESTKFRSKAYDLKSGAYLYSEYHNEYWKGEKHISSRISYWKGRTKIAVKKIRFYRSLFAPDYEFKDLRLDYVRGSRFLSGRYYLYRNSHEDRTIKSKRLRIPGPVVVDNGFNYYIREHFDSLSSGRTHIVNVITPGFLNWFRFRLRKSRNGVFRGRKTTVFIATPKNPVINMLADKIEAEYDQVTKRLLVYRGISNVKNPEGEYYHARVVYDYGKK